MASQNNEDNLIKNILTRIGIVNKTCVEFGAWDGEYLSNTWHLWHDLGWTALLIEGDKSRYLKLLKNIKHYRNCYVLNVFVMPVGPNSLDSILSRCEVGNCKIPIDLDILSIDVDGEEYRIWETLKIYSPRLVIIEYNPSIPPHIEYIQKEGGYSGSSALSLCLLAKSKGYVLVGITQTNLFFVKKEDAVKSDIQILDIKTAFDYNNLTYVTSDYSGNLSFSRTPIFQKGGRIRRALRKQLIKYI